MREARQHPPKLRAKFKHYASRIRAIPPGGKMPADLLKDARQLILQRMAQMTGQLTEPSRPGYGTNGTKRTTLVHTHQIGAEE